MCLIKCHRLPKRAHEDIVCYKCLKKNNLGFVTQYCETKVVPGKTILTSAKNIFWGIFRKEIHGEGVHSLVNCKKLEYNSIVFKAIIPKGAWYYNGKYGDLASNKLIITSERYNFYV